MVINNIHAFEKKISRIPNIQKLPVSDIPALSNPYARPLGNGQNRVNLLWLTDLLPTGVIVFIHRSGLVVGSDSLKNITFDVDE